MFKFYVRELINVQSGILETAKLKQLKICEVECFFYFVYNLSLFVLIYIKMRGQLQASTVKVCMSVCPTLKLTIINILV